MQSVKVRKNGISAEDAARWIAAAWGVAAAFFAVRRFSWLPGER